MAHVAPQFPHLVRRHEGLRQQSVAVELLYPLAVADVALASGRVLDVLRMDEADLEALTFQPFVGPKPLDARGLHGHLVHPARLEPAAHLAETFRVGTELAYGALPVRQELLADRHVVFPCPKVYARRIGVDLGQLALRHLLPLLFHGATIVLVVQRAGCSVRL